MLKCLERLVDLHLRDHLMLNCPLNINQFAFQSGKSTETALHTLTYQLENSLVRKEDALCAFLDIEGAFDNISYSAVEMSLVSRDVNRTTIVWISKLLKSRSITYETGGHKTSIIPTRGTPQGGVLSPTLWILVMDDLLHRLSREGYNIIGYADDLVVLCNGLFLNTLCELMQRALRIIERWCTEVGD